jgi:hypothetical protein
VHNFKIACLSTGACLDPHKSSSRPPISLLFSHLLLHIPSLPFRYLMQFVRLSHLPDALYFPHVSHSALFYQPSNTVFCDEYRFWGSSLCTFSSASFNLISLRSKYSQHPLFKHSEYFWVLRFSWRWIYRSWPSRLWRRVVLCVFSTVSEDLFLLNIGNQSTGSLSRSPQPVLSIRVPPLTPETKFHTHTKQTKL